MWHQHNILYTFSEVAQQWKIYLQCRRHVFNPWVGKIPWRKQESCNPLQYSCPENPTDRGAWRATVQGVARVAHDLATKPPLSPPYIQYPNLPTCLNIPFTGKKKKSYILQLVIKSLVSFNLNSSSTFTVFHNWTFKKKKKKNSTDQLVNRLSLVLDLPDCFLSVWLRLTTFSKNST